MSNFTIDINGARGAFDTIEEAKKESMALAHMNAPDVVIIENSEGMPVVTFCWEQNEMRMTTIRYDVLIVDYDDE